MGAKLILTINPAAAALYGQPLLVLLIVRVVDVDVSHRSKRFNGGADGATPALPYRRLQLYLQVQAHLPHLLLSW